VHAVSDDDDLSFLRKTMPTSARPQIWQ